MEQHAKRAGIFGDETAKSAAKTSPLAPLHRDLERQNENERERERQEQAAFEFSF